MNFAVSTQNRWVNNLLATGTFRPINLKGLNYDIDEHAEFILVLIDEKLNITLTAIQKRLEKDCDFRCSLRTISQFLDRHGVLPAKERQLICREREKLEKEGLENETEASVEVGTEFRSESRDGVIAAMRKDFQEFKAEVVDLGDERSGNAVKYTVASILNIARLAALRGSFTVKDIARYAEEKFDFLKQFVDLPDRPPSHWTFNRVPGKLDAEKLIKYLFKDVAEPFAFILRKLACDDGKLFNGSSKKSRNPAVTGVVTAMDQESGLIVNIAPYGQGIGEIPGMKDFLHGMNISSAWITADALHLQTETAEIISCKGGNYCLAVRDNQSTIEEAVHEIVKKRGNLHDGQFFVTEKKVMAGKW